MISASAGDRSASSLTRPRRSAGRERAAVSVAAVLVVALGVAAKLVVPGLTGDLLGSALYTVLIALLLRLVGPRLPAVVAAGAATTASIAVELLQLTGLPTAVSAVCPPAAWVLGSTFVATDLLGYVVGGVAALVLLRGLRRAS
jgi:hypothetical protein